MAKDKPTAKKPTTKSRSATKRKTAGRVRKESPKPKMKKTTGVSVVAHEPVDKETLFRGARNSLYVFTRYLLGYDQLLPEHRAWDEIYPQKRVTVLMPRESRKSTVLSIGGTVKDIAEAPTTHTTLLTTHDMLETEKVIAAIKRGLVNPLVQEYAPALRKLVGPDGRAAAKWTERVVDLRHADFPESLKRHERTVMGAAALVSSVGGHYRKVLADDIVDIKDKMSAAVRNAKREYLTNLEDLVASDGGAFWIIGTRWHPYDAYELAIKHWPEFRQYIRGVYNDERTPGLPPGVLWCAPYYKERLERLKRDPVRWSLQYLNVPVVSGEKVADLSWFLPITAPKPEDVLVSVCGVDAAYSERDVSDSCYHAACIWWLLKDMRLVLRDGLLMRGSFDDFRHEVKELSHRHRASFVVCEDNGPQKAAVLALKDIGPWSSGNWAARVEGASESGVIMTQDKVTRARGWLTHAEVQGIYVVEGPWWEEASYQIDLFPGGQYKDFPDAMSAGYNRAQPSTVTSAAKTIDRKEQPWHSVSMLGGFR